MKKRLIHLAAWVLIGLLILTGLAWRLTRTLGNCQETLYAGQSLTYWHQQLEGRDPGASNSAFVVVNTQVIPHLVDTLFHDTTDSKIKLVAIQVLNSLPGIRINFYDAFARRLNATASIGDLGPPAKAAVPALIEALKDKDSGLQEPVIIALGEIHSDPDLVIPLLIPFLTHDGLKHESAAALGNYGSVARAAFPKIIPLLNAPDDDVRDAAREALGKMDPAAAAKLGVK